MLARRMMAAGRGFTAPPPLDQTPVEVIADGGGWAEPQWPKVLRYGDWTMPGWCAGTSGDVAVAACHNGTRLASPAQILHEALGGEGTADMHDNPSLLIRASDKRLMTFYCKHAGTTIYMRISNNPVDVDPGLTGGFAAEVSLHSQILASKYDYPIAIQLDDGTIYLFFRSQSGSTARWLYSTSTDGGATWSINRWLYRNTGFTPYGQIKGSGNRIDFIFQNKNEAEVTNNEIRHGYLTGGKFYTTTGTEIGTAPLATPLTPANLTLAASGAGYHLFGLERNPTTGHIAFTASARVSGVHHVYRVMWDTATWATSDIAVSPGPGGLASGSYSWGNGIDPTDFDHAVFVLWEDNRSNLWDGRLIDGEWVNTLRAAGTAGHDWMWPIFATNGAPGVEVWALNGHYTGYINDQFGFSIYAMAA